MQELFGLSRLPKHPHPHSSHPRPTSRLKQPRHAPWKACHCVGTVEGYLRQSASLDQLQQAAADGGFGIGYGVAVRVVAASVGERHQCGQGEGCVVGDGAEFGLHGGCHLNVWRCGGPSGGLESEF